MNNIKKSGEDFGDFLADQKKFKNPLIEAVDNPILRKFFGTLFERIPEEYQDEVIKLVDIIKDGEISEEEWTEICKMTIDNASQVLSTDGDGEIPDDDDPGDIPPP